MCLHLALARIHIFSFIRKEIWISAGFTQCEAVMLAELTYLQKLKGTRKGEDTGSLNFQWWLSNRKHRAWESTSLKKTRNQLLYEQEISPYLHGEPMPVCPFPHFPHSDCTLLAKQASCQSMKGHSEDHLGRREREQMDFPTHLPMIGISNLASWPFLGTPENTSRTWT